MIFAIARKLRLPAGLLVVFGVLGSGHAETATFDVTATVVDSCTLSAGNTLAFGNYDPNAAEVDGSTTISASCTSGTTADIAIDGGGAADTANRQMSGNTDGTNKLGYQLYSDSGRTTVWGEGVDAVTYTGIGVLTSEDLTVYGRIAAAQDVPVDTYSDTVTVTLTIN